MNFKKTYTPKTGFTPLCRIGECSLKNLEFGIIELNAGDSVDYSTENSETAFIMLEGHVNVAFGNTEWKDVGNRNTVFENKKAVCFYLPRDTHVTICSSDHSKIAVCSSPTDVMTEPQLLGEDRVVLKLLGKQPYQRETSFLIDGSTNAKKLTIGEAYCTEGNWAGFPPHKHDVDDMPSECVAEEIYYFLFEPKQGFAVQCVYTSDGSIDEAYRVKNDDLVEFPYGYHTTVSTPGYKTYFLWLMAGDHQGFNRRNDPEHAWIEKKQ